MLFRAVSLDNFVAWRLVNWTVWSSSRAKNWLQPIVNSPLSVVQTVASGHSYVASGGGRRSAIAQIGWEQGGRQCRRVRERRRRRRSERGVRVRMVRRLLVRVRQRVWVARRVLSALWGKQCLLYKNWKVYFGLFLTFFSFSNFIWQRGRITLSHNLLTASIYSTDNDNVLFTQTIARLPSK